MEVGTICSRVVNDNDGQRNAHANWYYGNCRVLKVLKWENLIRVQCVGYTKENVEKRRSRRMIAGAINTALNGLFAAIML